jgi:type II secretory pathway predicted ATPase ExeA
MTIAQFMSYFGFLSMPFVKTTEPKNLFLSRLVKQVLDRMESLIGQRGIALLCGDAGAGKTTAMRAFVATLDVNAHQIVYVDNPTIGSRGIFNSVASQLNIDPPYQNWKLMKTLKEIIEKNQREYKKTTVLIIDDAHLLKPATLEELRLFTNFRFDAWSPMTLILMAQPQLRQRLQLNYLQAFRQRITFQAHITGIEQNEAKPFIDHQLRQAGRTDHIFSDNVCLDIYQHARGLPRVINTLALNCLWEICRQNKNVVDPPILEKVLMNDQFT